MTLGDIIKNYRTEHNLSMDAFSEKSGISKAYISLLEKNKHPKTGKAIAPSIQCIKQAANGMDIDFNNLFSMLDCDVSLSETDNISSYVEIGYKIKEAREQKNLTQKQLADLIGAAHNSISDWENNKNKPDLDTIKLLCGALKITPNYLLASTEDDFSPKEKLLIKKYRSLDNFGKERIEYELDRETERIKELQKQSEYIKKLEVNADDNNESNIEMRLINYYYRVASAGTGQIIFDMPPTKRIEIPNTLEYRKVDYAIGVNGNSMEPLYHDGDMLLVEMTEDIEIGDIGIFRVDNESYVKKLGETELISLNPDARNIPLNESAGCMGKVIGKLPNN